MMNKKNIKLRIKTTIPNCTEPINISSNVCNMWLSIIYKYVI